MNIKVVKQRGIISYSAAQVLAVQGEVAKLREVFGQNWRLLQMDSQNGHEADIPAT